MPEEDQSSPSAELPFEATWTTRTMLLLVAGVTLLLVGLVGKGVLAGMGTGVAVAVSLACVGFLGAETLAELMMKRRRRAARLSAADAQG